MKQPESTLSLKYPTYRDDPIKNVFRWLDGKRCDDNAEGLWRIHDKLYNLTDFIDRHPGGRDWLIWTKGVDITEEFETHHLYNKAEKLLSKFYVKDASEPRNYKITFEEDGFYRTLKRKVMDKLKSDIDFAPASYSNIVTDLLVITTFITAILSARFESYFWVIISGVALCWSIICAHNFFHRKDNFRMYYFNLSLFNYSDWRISHAISHHLYTNTYHDLEISMFEPFLIWIPKPKSLVKRYGSWIYTPLVYLSLFHQSFVSRFIWHFKSDNKCLSVDDFVALTVPLAMYLFGKSVLSDVFILWTMIVLTASFVFCVIGLNAGHHHPGNAHEGDELCKSMDFGILQMDAVIDRIDLKSSQFLVLTHFGEHTLHHLFPTLDHGILPQLNEIFLETCSEFDTELREYPWYKLIQGQFQQLARVKPMALKDKGRNA